MIDDLRDAPLDLAVTFLVFARDGNLEAAGRRLGITGKGVKQRIKRLEEGLAPRKLLRPSGGLGLTSYGAQLRDQCREAFDRLDRVWTEAVASTRPRTLRIAATGVGVQQELPPILRDLSRRFPDLPITVRHETSTDVKALVLGGDVDFGIGREQEPVDGLVQMKFAGGRLVVAYPIEEDVDELRSVDEVASRWSWLLPEKFAEGERLLSIALGLEGTPPVVRFHVGRYEDAVAAAAQGLGATLCAEGLVEPWKTKLRTLVPERIQPEDRQFRGALMWMGDGKAPRLDEHKAVIQRFAEEKGIDVPWRRRSK